MSRQQGLSLIESLVCLAVVGILAALACPALSELVQRQRLQGVAETFRNDFQQARMLALGSGRSVRVSFERGDAGSCYVVYQGDKGDCNCGDGGAPVCKSATQLISHQWLASRAGLSLDASAKQLTIEAGLGMVTPTTTVKLQSSSGAGIAHVVAVTGRLRSCEKASAAGSICA